MNLESKGISHKKVSMKSTDSFLPSVGEIDNVSSFMNAPLCFMPQLLFKTWLRKRWPTVCKIRKINFNNFIPYCSENKTTPSIRREFWRKISSQTYIKAKRPLVKDEKYIFFSRFNFRRSCFPDYTVHWLSTVWQ